MQVSVIIPVYQAERFLERAVNSALACSEVGEVVLVEDGSPDGSLAICERLVEADGRVKLFRHPGGVNKGAGATRNLGIEKAGNDFIAFLDADDHYLPHRFQGDARVFSDRPDADGVYGVTGVVYHDDSSDLRERFRHRELTSMGVEVSPENLFETINIMGGGGGHFHLDALTVKRSAIDRAGMFEAALRLSQDTHFILRLAACCRLYSNEVAEPVAMRGVHLQNRSADLSKCRAYWPAMFRSLLVWASAHRQTPERLAAIYRKYRRELDLQLAPRPYLRRRIDKLTAMLSLALAHPSLFRVMVKERHIAR